MSHLSKLVFMKTRKNWREWLKKKSFERKRDMVSLLQETYKKTDYRV